ncbi:MAG: Nicotinamide-nucleotide adenylyltransferase [Parcubacteria group bacterium GW2011_GWA2_47_26]|nr:MAG: Nicotinamide-nucleotide adenylyltransferase [Parcubacteria group bacterium GW2011_GWA2_47_26]
MQEIGLFIGRFQPLHKGHMLAMRDCVRRANLLIVAIGSPQESGTYKNPFMLAERKEMVNKVMKGIGAEKYKIIELPDTATDAEWVELVKKQAGKFDMAWSGNDLVIKIFKAAGLPVKRIDEYPGVSATKIRRRICTGTECAFVAKSRRCERGEAEILRHIRSICRKISAKP